MNGPDHQKRFWLPSPPWERGAGGEGAFLVGLPVDQTHQPPRTTWGREAARESAIQTATEGDS